jgi:hypothetical protein
MVEPAPSELAEVEGFQECGVPRDHLLVFWALEAQLYVSKAMELSNAYEIRHNLSADEEENVKEIRLESKWATRGLPEKHSFIVFAVTHPHELVHPMLIERVGTVCYRANFMSARSYMKIDEWFQYSPERKLVILA